MFAIRAFGLASFVLATSAFAAEPFACKAVNPGELRVYRDLASPENKGAGGPVKLKKGAILVDEQRALVSDWFKPDGGTGGVIPYKQPQVVFSPYLIETREMICSSQRHGDVFGPAEMGQQYLLRCLVDTDNDLQFDAFHRYGELVSYDFRSGKSGVPTGAPQTDVPLAQKFKLVTAEPSTANQSAFTPILRSVVWIVDMTKTSATLRARSQIEIPSFQTKLETGAGKVRPNDVKIPLHDGAEALVGNTRITVGRAATGWIVSAPDGFASDAKLICGGTVLETSDAFTVFAGGGLVTFSRKENARQP